MASITATMVVSTTVSTMAVDFFNGDSTNVADGKALCLYLMRVCSSLVPVGIQFCFVSRTRWRYLYFFIVQIMQASRPTCCDDGDLKQCSLHTGCSTLR